MGMPIFFESINLSFDPILYQYNRNVDFFGDCSLSWGASFFVFFSFFSDWVLSAMDNLPLYVGGGRSTLGPSQRPLIDLPKARPAFGTFGGRKRRHVAKK